MIELNKLFPWLSIRSKLIIAFVGLSILPIILVGIYGIISNTKSMKANAVQKLNHDLSLIQENTANLMINIERDLMLIQKSYLNSRIRSDINSGVYSSDKKNIQILAEELLSFAETRDIYYQLRIVDNKGNEVARVQSAASYDLKKRYSIVPANNLRHIPQVYYLLMIKDLTKNQIALAPAELLSPDNKPVPVISFAMPIYLDDKVIGILIADVFVKNFFKTLQTYKSLNPDEKVILVSGDGHYLYHSQKKKNWNKLLAARDEFNLQHDYPEEIAKQILSGKDSVITQGSEDIISHSPLFQGYSSIYRTGVEQNLAIQLYLLVAVPKTAILQPVYLYIYTFAGILALFLIISIVLSLLATRHFTTSIGKLTVGAETITKGNYNHRVKVETRDELEKLAEQFNLMAQSLHEHEEEIQRYKTHLEEMVESRTEELFAEKSKLQAILDNVPSAFLLLDKDLRIQTASAAFKTITGYNIDDVKGENCSKIFGDNGFCQECICLQAISKNKIKSCIYCTDDDRQHQRYIERVAIPMKANGEVVAVLAVITDITKRKQLENVLLKTEKLAATGEIAAFVAHEFRNSLTSIKMILQLLAESNHLAKSEKKSVTVALKSTSEMEDTVTKLLNYAYPVPMNFQTASIEDILNESLTFVQLRANESKISIKKEIERSTPSILLDASRLKEAIINILLNAVQAIDEKRNSFESIGPDEARDTEIFISIRKMILRRTLHDFKLEEAAGYTNTEDVGRNRYEIILPKGTECIVLQITDSGMGIDSSNISRIFDPFFTTKTNGTGLGLPMVKRTINAHRGIITVESKKGTGTTFSIYLPLLKEGHPAQEQLI